jgi:pimeloyl-ACP methyl ester carboxylesterase
VAHDHEIHVGDRWEAAGMPTASTADGTTIAYDSVGSGPPIVFVHGITDDRSDWADQMSRFATDHRVVALDLRGHGESGDAADHSALSMAFDVAAVVEAEQLDAPVVVGHSLGGAVVSVYAASAPVRAVVDVDQSLRFRDFAAALRPLDGQLRDPATFPGALAAIFDVMTGEMLDADTRVRLAARRATARQDVVLGVWDLVLSSTDEELDATTDGVGAAITAPFLSLHGLDPGDDYEAWLAERIGGTVTVELWPEHGHYLHLVDPDRFEERVRTFLSQT